MTTQHPNSPGFVPEGFDIPSGVYKGRGVAGSDQYGVGDKGEQVAVDLNLSDLGRLVTTILHFSEAAAPYSIDRLKLMGWKGGDTFDGIDENEVPVRISYEQWTSPETQTAEWKMKVDIIATRFSFKTPMNDAQKRGFFAKLNQIASQHGGAPARPAGPPPAGAGALPPPGSTGAPAGGYPQNWDDKPAADPNRPALKL